MKGFLVKVNENEETRVSVRELRNLVSAGNGCHDVLVWDAVLEDWVSSRRLTEITAAERPSKVKPQKCPKILALAGDKGGVGKSVLSTSIGVGLASLGKEVILVDGDLAGPDLHTCMGILEPKFTFFDFYALAKDSLS